MINRELLALGGAAVGIGAAAFGLHRATHPADARVIPLAGGRRNDDALLDLPDGVTEHVIDSHDGGTIRYLEKGSGQPLVLLHGVTLRAEVWAPQFHDLPDTFRVIAVDLRGHGGSHPGRDGFGLSRFGDDVATLLETLDLRDAILVGHSMGGMTVMTFCSDHQDVLAERVAGAVFVATTASRVYPPLIDGPLRRLVGRGQGMVAAGRPLPGGAKADRRLVRVVFGDHPSPKAIGIVAEMTNTMEPAAMLASVDQMFDHDTRVALRATHTPSMVIMGTRDTLTPVPAGRALARLLPDCDFVLLPRAGHQLMQERPEVIDELLRAFAARIAGDADAVVDAVDAAGDEAIVETGITP